MRKLIFTFLALTISFSLVAQQEKECCKKNEGAACCKADKESVSKSGWSKKGEFNFIVGQGGSRNWAAGSQRFSLMGDVTLNFQANRTWRKNIWENNFDLAYGVLNISKVGLRKIDDKIDFTSLFRHSVSKNNVIGVGGWFNMRSQFHNGYDYAATGKNRISGLMAPGYLTLAPGIELRPKCFSMFISPVASRMIVFTNEPYSFQYQGGVKPDGTSEVPLSWFYNVDPERKVRFEFGALVSTKLSKNIAKNVGYRTRLDVFSNYVDDPQNIDVFWNNNFEFKVNKCLSASYTFDLIYDDDVKMFGPLKNKAATQMRSQLGVGLVAKFR